MRITTQNDHALGIRFSSTLAEVDQACQLAQDFLREKLHHKNHFMTILCLREALTNAVIHGNRENPLKPVTCQIVMDADHLDVVVTDQGHGFSWRSRKWELPPPNSESGRGLEIIRNWFDRVAFNPRGNQITLCKRLNSPGASTMLHIHQEGPKTVARVTRNMAGANIDELRDALKNLVASGHTELTIDLRDVDQVDSLGMGLLVATHNSLHAKQGALAVVNVNPDIYHVLTTMRLDKHFTITPVA